MLNSKLRLEDKAVGAKTDNSLKGPCLCCKVDAPLDPTLAGTASSWRLHLYAVWDYPDERGISSFYHAPFFVPMRPELN